MYEGRELPEYLSTSPILIETRHPYAVLEPNSGNQIPPSEFNNILSPRQRSAVTKFKDIIRGAKTYGQLIDRIASVTEQVSDVYKSLLHHIIEDDSGLFAIGLQVMIKASPTDYDIVIATAVNIPLNMDKFDIIYDDEDVLDVDALTTICASTTNAIASIGQTTHVENPLITNALIKYHQILMDIDAYRWSGVKCELLGGVPALYVMRRWGIVNLEGIVDGAENEYTKFGDLVAKYGKKK